MLNSIILMGRLCADPDYRTTQSGIPVVSFRIAVDRGISRDKVQPGQQTADFIDIVAWRERADFASRYFRKGQLVAVQGSLQTRNYEDKNGNRRTAFEVQADRLHFAESKREGGNYESPASYYSNTNQSGQSNDQSNNTAPAIYERTEEPSSFSAGSDDDFTPVPDEDLPF